MSIDSSADLLFRISADSTPAQADLAALRGAVAETCSGMASDVGAAGDAATTSFNGMGEGARSASGHMRETREALRGLGEEIGVTMPRFVNSWLASLGPVAGIMSVAFAPIAVIGLVEVLGRIPGALQKGIDWLHGWTAEAKKAFEQTTKDELEWETRTIRLDERLRAIALIGKEGMEKWHLAAAINSQDYDQVKAKIAELNQALIENAAIAARPMGAKALMGETDVSKLQMGPSHEEIEKAKVNVKELGPIIKELSAQLDDLGIKGKEITAQTAAAAAKEGKESVADLRAVSAVLTEVQGKLAGMAGGEAKAKEEFERLSAAADRALEATAAKKPSADVAARELAAWKQLQVLLPQLYTETVDEIAKKRAEKTAEAAAQIKRQIAEEGAQTLAGKLAAFDAEIEAQALTYQKEGTLSTANWEALIEKWKAGRAKLTAEQAKASAKEIGELQKQLAEETGKSVEAEHKALDRKLNLELAEAMREERATQELVDAIAAVRAAGHAKIDRDNQVAFAGEIARLDEHLKSIERRDETSRERIVSAYRADVEKIDAAEQEETAKKSLSEAQRAEIAARYAAIRKALVTKEGTELQELKNSQGWQGVFGSKFAEEIRGNEKLWNEWKNAVHQSHMLVRVSLEAMKEEAQKAFAEFAQGEGAAIANAVVYEKSVGKAMEAALKSTLASLAAQAAAQAIYCTGWGLWDLAIGDYEGAGQAFAAAAIFGSLGAAAAVAGRAVPGDQSGASGAGAGAGGDRGRAGGGGVTGQETGGTAAGQGGPHVSITIMGHVIGQSGMAEVADMLSDAVVNSGVKLTATNTTTGAQLIR